MRRKNPSALTLKHCTLMIMSLSKLYLMSWVNPQLNFHSTHDFQNSKTSKKTFVTFRHLWFSEIVHFLLSFIVNSLPSLLSHVPSNCITLLLSVITVYLQKMFFLYLDHISKAKLQLNEVLFSSPLSPQQETSFSEVTTLFPVRLSCSKIWDQCKRAYCWFRSGEFTRISQHFSRSLTAAYRDIVIAKILVSFL